MHDPTPQSETPAGRKVYRLALYLDGERAEAFERELARIRADVPAATAAAVVVGLLYDGLDARARRTT